MNVFPVRPTVLHNGNVWEYRGRTPGGMVRLWAIGGGASLTARRSEVTIPSSQIAAVVRFDDAERES